MATVAQLPAGNALTVRATADAFLNALGEGRPLGQVADDEIGEALDALWGSTAVNTWDLHEFRHSSGNRGRAC